MLQIFTPKIKDVDQLKTFATLSFRQAYPSDSDQDVTNMNKYCSQNFKTALFEADLVDKRCIYFVLKEKENWLGYAKLRWDRSHPDLGNEKNIELQRLYVLDSAKGKGVGSDLTKHCIDFAKTKGYHWLWLVVYNKNKKAIRFYQKFGFKKFGVALFQFGDTMEKDDAMRLELVNSNE